MNAEVREGIRSAMRLGRQLAKQPSVEAVAVLTVQPSTNIPGGVAANGSMFGSPAEMVAAAGYLLRRVRDDAMARADEDGAHEYLKRLDAALALLVFDDIGARH